MRFSETPDAYKELSRAVYLRTSTIAGEQMLIFASPTQAKENDFNLSQLFL